MYKAVVFTCTNITKKKKKKKKKKNVTDYNLHYIAYITTLNIVK